MKLPAASCGHLAKFSEATTLLRQGYGGFSSPSSPQQPTPPKQPLRLRRLEATGYLAKEKNTEGNAPRLD